MSVKARFYVSQVTKHANGGSTEQPRAITLLPVVRPTPDNVEWSKYTPSGKIEMTVTAEPAASWFEDHLGKDVSITFEDVEA